jgi:hypothetical protein
MIESCDAHQSATINLPQAKENVPPPSSVSGFTPSELGDVQAEKKRLRDMNRLEDQEDQG